MKLLSLSLAALVLGLPSVALAESCNSRIDPALEDLKEVVPDMDILQQAEVRGILRELCQGPRKVAERPAEEDEPEPEPDEESTSFFGMDVQRAPEDSKGRDRLKRTH